MNAIVGVTEVRTHLRETIAKAQGGPVKIVRHSRVVAVMLSPQRYEALLNLCESLEDQCSVLYAQLHPEESQRLTTGS